MSLKTTKEFLDKYIHNFEVNKNEHALSITNESFVEKDLHGFFICDLYFDLCDLERAKVKNFTFDKCEFFGVNIVEALFEKTYFENCLFYGVSGFYSNFSNCIFNNTRFLGCNLEEAKFDECEFNQVFIGPDNINCPTDISDARFHQCKFHETKFDTVMTSEKTELDVKLLS